MWKDLLRELWHRTGICDMAQVPWSGTKSCSENDSFCHRLYWKWLSDWAGCKCRLQSCFLEQGNMLQHCVLWLSVLLTRTSYLSGFMMLHCLSLSLYFPCMVAIDNCNKHIQGMQSIKPSCIGSFLSPGDLPNVTIISSPVSGGEQVIWLFLFLFLLCFVLCVNIWYNHRLCS